MLRCDKTQLEVKSVFKNVKFKMKQLKPESKRTPNVQNGMKFRKTLLSGYYNLKALHPFVHLISLKQY